jgi:beta-glucosidase
MFMEPNTLAAVRDHAARRGHGRAASPMSRIDDAVRRILTKKFQLGLFEQPFTRPHDHRPVGSPRTGPSARPAVAESQVLLKNAGHALPLRPDARSTWPAQRRRHRQPGRRLDDHLAGLLRRHHPRERRSSQGIRQVAPAAQVTYSADALGPGR